MAEPLIPWQAQALRERLAGFDVLALPTEGLRRAAVALVCTEAGQGADLPGLPPHGTWRASSCRGTWC